MIIFANENLWEYFAINPEKYHIMNFLSKFNIGDTIKNLIPPSNIFNNRVMDYYRNYNEQFRIMYLQYLCSYDAFLSILEIMMNDYYYDNIVILTDTDNEITLGLLELISQFIYDRYMYQPIIINDIEDLTVIKPESIPMERIGIFQNDKEYYIRQTTDPKKLLDQIDDLEVANSGTV